MRIVKVFWGLDSALAYQRHFPAINWLTSYSLYVDDMGKWFDENVDPDWMKNRQKMMNILQDESELNEVVQMVGMDALSASDRLKMEAARSIREDYLHQNSFDEVDTYTSLQKQHYMMEMVIAYYEKTTEALNEGASLNDLISLPVREKIGRYKYTKEENIKEEYDNIISTLEAEIKEALSRKEDF